MESYIWPFKSREKPYSLVSPGHRIPDWAILTPRRSIKECPQLDLELENVELELKPRHSDSRILELNLYAESRHELGVGQIWVQALALPYKG